MKNREYMALLEQREIEILNLRNAVSEKRIMVQ
jgi:hypothetical protein